MSRSTTRLYVGSEVAKSSRFCEIKKLALCKNDGLGILYKWAEEGTLRPHVALSVLFIDSQPVAVASVRLTDNYFQCFTVSSFRGKGYAKRLVQFLSKKFDIRPTHEVSCFQFSKMEKLLRSAGFENVEYGFL